jgi:2-methylcitrate dehydratase
MAAGVSKALGLDQTKTANAIAISGTAFNALRVTRTGRLSHWKGLASPNTAFSATHAAFLAMRGISGPPEVFEGNKGFMDSIAGKFYIDWQDEDLERVTQTILKKYNAEIHSQSAIEGILELREAYGVQGDEVELIELEIFQVAFDIIGGGEEGSKRFVQTKEEADHSLPYLLAVALLDGQVGPSQYTDERIQSADVQDLLTRVFIRPSDDYSSRFPAEMPCHLRIVLKDGRKLEVEKRDYEGFHTRPMTWDTVSGKFSWLSRGFASPALQQQIISAVVDLESVPVTDLMSLLVRIGPGQR